MAEEKKKRQKNKGILWLGYHRYPRKKQRHLWLGYHRYHGKKFSPFSHICAFETVVDKFFTSINLYPSLSSVLKVYSSSKLSERSSSSAYFIFFLEEPTVSLESKSESWFSSREVVGVEEAISSTTGAVSSGSSSCFRLLSYYLSFLPVQTYIHTQALFILGFHCSLQASISDPNY